MLDTEENLQPINVKLHCTCKWCTTISPNLQKLEALIPHDDKSLREFYDWFVVDYMVNSEDAVYYRMRADGEWQSCREDLQYDIECLTRKMNERFPIDNVEKETILTNE